MENKVYLRSFQIALALFLAQASHAQQFTIADGTITTCTGVLGDSGGPASSYGDNENYTVVICPDNPGDVITLLWTAWSVSTAGPQASWDRIRIWDGNSTAGNLIGDYTGNDPLGGAQVQANTTNPTGCLTVQFISNGTGVGDFSASILCETPCDRPTAVATMSEQVPALVCVNEVLTFDGSGSYAAPGFALANYQWSFDDGETSTGPTASHSFDEPGEYIVQLTVTDDNNCVNNNFVDLQVLVSTTPEFSGTMENIGSCVGAEVALSAEVTPTTWTGIPESNFGGQLLLPDDVGLPFTTELVFTQFEAGQTLQDVNDLLSVCVSMEHSFMGDLILSLTCPNGQSITMHQQGGGGTFLGDANDGDGGGVIVPGTCWDYCWSPTATLGTWEQSSQFGASPNVMPSSQGTALIPDTYSSLQPFTQLLGCPLNGAWTFMSVDNWLADNGSICSWSLNFDPAIIPEATQFTPELGTSTLDSAGWSGPGLAIDPADPLNASASISSPGDYQYSFFVTDNHGCEYDTTITITVPEQPVLDAGEPIVLCSDPLPMAGAIVANGPPPTCTWELMLYESFGDSWNGGANLAVTYDGVTTNYSVPNGPEELSVPLVVETGETIELFYTAGTVFNGENSFTLFDDTGAEIFASVNGPSTGLAYSGVVVCGGGETAFVFEWTPTTGLDDPSDPETNVYVTEPTLFYLSTYPTGHPECAVMDSVWVSPDPSIDAGEPATMIICASDPTFQLTDSLGGTPDDDGEWTNSAGGVVSNTFEPITGASDVYTYTVTSAAGCVATSTLDITVIPADDPTCCGVVDAGIDAFTCGLTIELSATRGNTGVGNWQGPAGAVFADPFNTVTAVTVQPGMGGTHTFYWVENDGAFCDLIDSVRITFTDAYVFTPTVTDALCYGYSDGAITMDVTGGNAAAGLDFSWSTGLQGIMENTITDLLAGTYSLLVTDDNGCTGTTEVLVGQPIRLEIDSMAMLPVTCSGDCDGTVQVFDAEAVEYSYDDGTTWTTDPTRPASCEGVWVVRIKDAIGCIGIDQIELMGPPPVVAAFDWGPNPANVDAPTITFANTSTGSDHYFWNVADLFSTTDLNTVFTFDNKEPDMYEVCLTAYNYNECADTICQTVVIDDVLFTYIPNAFTPDGDDVNDVWWPSANIPVRTNYELLVFDRWGQVVFNTTDPYMPWEGSYQNGGEILKSDVYAFRLLYGIGDTEARKEVVGYVTLMK